MRLENKHYAGRSSRQFDFKELLLIMALISLAARSSLVVPGAGLLGLWVVFLG